MVLEQLVQLRAPLWLFSQTKVEAPWWLFSFFSNLHQYDFSPEQNGKFIGRNVIMVLTFFFFEPYRGSRGLPLVFLDCFMYLPHFRISGVATYKPSLGPFFGSKEKKPLNLHISKSILAPIWRFSRTLQSWNCLQRNSRWLHRTDFFLFKMALEFFGERRSFEFFGPDFF